MKRRKRILGYTMGEVEISVHTANVRTVCVTIGEFDICDPAAELLHASRYTDHSLAEAQRKARRALESGAAYWLEANYCDAWIEFTIQGSIDSNDWYATSLESVQFKRCNLKLIAKIGRAVGDGLRYGSEHLAILVAALKKLKARQIIYDREVGVWLECKNDSLGATTDKQVEAI